MTGYVRGLAVAAREAQAKIAACEAIKRYALLEGMAAGRAIVASAVAGIPDVITSGEHGLLVPEGDETQLAAAISQLFANPEYAHQLGIAARNQVSDALTWSRVTARLVAGYAKVCGR